MKIALIDSGIEHISKRIIEVRSYIDSNGKDEFGHGTMCFNIINQTRNTNIEVIQIKVLDKNGRTKLSILEKALQDLLYDDVELICMSLAAVDCNEKNDLLKRIWDICNTLLKRGVCIVSSHANRHGSNSFPASFGCVVGVQGAIFKDENEYWYNKNRMEIVADCTPVIVRNHKNERKVFSGNSKANAIMIKKILDQYIENEDIYSNLLKEAKRNLWNVSDIKKTIFNCIDFKELSGLKYYDDLIQLCQYYPCYASDNFKSYNNNIDFDFYLRLDMCGEIIKLIENHYGRKVEDSNISVGDFLNIYRLCDALETRWFYD